MIFPNEIRKNYLGKIMVDEIRFSFGYFKVLGIWNSKCIHTCHINSKAKNQLSYNKQNMNKHAI